MRRRTPFSRGGPRPISPQKDSSPRNNSKQSSLAPDEQNLIREFIQALSEEIEAIKKGRGGSVITVYDGNFVRREGPFFIYVFTTQSPLIVMDDTPAEVEIGGQKIPGQIVSVQGSEVAVGIEQDFGKTIAQARLITNLWYLLEALRKRFEELLDGERTLDTRLGQRLFGFVPADVRQHSAELKLPPSPTPLNGEQLAAIRTACGSDVHFIWGPPGTGKTQTIGFLIAALIKHDLRVLVASHTNVATDHAITNAANLLLDSDDYRSGKLLRYGPPSPNTQLPEMVIPDKVVERLGHQLKQRLSELQNQIAPIKYELTALRVAQALLSQKEELDRNLRELEVSFLRCFQEHEGAKSSAIGLSATLQSAEARLVEAQSAGKLKRLFQGLNPSKIQAEVLRLRNALSVTRSTIDVGVSKLKDFRTKIESAQQQREQASQEAHQLLTRHKVNAEQLSQRIAYLAKQERELTAVLFVVQAELETLATKILREAKLIATSLTKATITKQIDELAFDVLVVDEASMAPMPALYFATGRASKKVIVVGDFRQLPPICVADTEMAQKWLARDIFDQAGIQRAVNERRQESRLTMLRRQYRMHPDISAISNQVIYDGRLVDSLSRDMLDQLSAFQAKSPLARTALLILDVSSVNPWSSRLDQGGRYNLYSAVLSAELAKRAQQAGIKSLGIISPYAVHARLIKMILDDSNDPVLRHLKFPRSTDSKVWSRK